MPPVDPESAFPQLRAGPATVTVEVGTDNPALAPDRRMIGRHRVEVPLSDVQMAQLMPGVLRGLSLGTADDSETL